MPPKINKKSCTGCLGKEEAFCEEICPGNLMTRGSDGKSLCRTARDCWDCMSCVKACPRGAISTVLPYQLGYFGASMKAVVGEDQITWMCVDLDGREQKFSFKTKNKAR